VLSSYFLKENVAGFTASRTQLNTENDGPQNNDTWKMKDLENDGLNLNLMAGK